MPLSSYHVKCIYNPHDLPCWYDHLAEVALVRFLQWTVTFTEALSILKHFPYCPLWKGVTRHNLHINVGSYPPLPQGQSIYINYLEFFCMGDWSLLPLYLPMHSFIYLCMDSLIFYTLEYIQYYLLIYFFKLYPEVLTSEGLEYGMVLPQERTPWLGDRVLCRRKDGGSWLWEASTPSVFCIAVGSLAAVADNILGKWEKWRHPPPLLTTLEL